MHGQCSITLFIWLYSLYCARSPERVFIITRIRFVNFKMGRPAFLYNLTYGSRVIIITLKNKGTQIFRIFLQEERQVVFSYFQRNSLLPYYTSNNKFRTSTEFVHALSGDLISATMSRDGFFLRWFRLQLTCEPRRARLCKIYEFVLILYTKLIAESHVKKDVNKLSKGVSRTAT